LAPRPALDAVEGAGDNLARDVRLPQHPRPEEDRRERRPEFMRERQEEGVLGAVGGLGLPPCLLSVPPCRLDFQPGLFGQPPQLRVRASERLGLRPRGPLATELLLALARVAYYGHDQPPPGGLDGAQADLHGQLRAVAVNAVEFEPRAHGPCPRLAVVGAAVGRVPLPEAARHEYLDGFAEQLRAGVAEEALGLGVHKDQAPLAISDHDGVRRGVHECRPPRGTCLRRPRYRPSHHFSPPGPSPLLPVSCLS